MSRADFSAVDLKLMRENPEISANIKRLSAILEQADSDVLPRLAAVAVLSGFRYDPSFLKGIEEKLRRESEAVAAQSRLVQSGLLWKPDG